MQQGNDQGPVNVKVAFMRGDQNAYGGPRMCPPFCFQACEGLQKMEGEDGEPTQFVYEQTMLLTKCTYDKIMASTDNKIRYSDGNLPMDALVDSENFSF
jgi:hypothetical protein